MINIPDIPDIPRVVALPVPNGHSGFES